MSEEQREEIQEMFENSYEPVPQETCKYEKLMSAIDLVAGAMSNLQIPAKLAPRYAVTLECLEQFKAVVFEAANGEGE